MTGTDLPYPGAELPEKRYPGAGVPERPLPGGDAPEGRDHPRARRERTWLKQAIVLLLLAVLGWVMLLAFQYCRTRAPIQELPGLAGLLGSQQFHYADSFSGVSGLNRPYGVAANGAGDRIYVSEIDGDRRIVMFNRAGQEIGSFVPPDTSLAGRVPLYVAVGPDDRVYVSDRRSRSIHIFGPDGEPFGTFEPQSVAADEWFPMGLAFDAEGSLYVTDVTPDKHRVMVFDTSGALKLEFGSEGTEEGQFRFPSGIAVDSSGRIYVADGNNGRVQVFDSQGQYLHKIAGGYAEADLALPRGVAIDGEDHLLVVDSSQAAIKVYGISGDAPQFLYAFGGHGLGDGQFRFPNGIAVDSGGRLYVADKENGRIQIWSYQR